MYQPIINKIRAISALYNRLQEKDRNSKPAALKMSQATDGIMVKQESTGKRGSPSRESTFFEEEKGHTGTSEAELKVQKGG